MGDQIMEIVARLRELREISDFSVEEMASAVGVSVEEYTRYESGEKDLPISVVLEVAEKCGVEPSILLTGEEPKLHEFCVTRAGHGRGVERSKEYHYQSLAYNFGLKKVDPFYVTAGPVPAGTPLVLNAHEGQEFDYVLEGYLKIILGGNELLLSPGDSIYYDSSLAHAMYAVEGDCKFIAVVVKSGEALE